MRIHTVQQCCCGCSLETGSKIIAWLQIVPLIICTISLKILSSLYPSHVGSRLLKNVTSFANTVQDQRSELLAAKVLSEAERYKQPAHWPVTTLSGPLNFKHVLKLISGIFLTILFIAVIAVLEEVGSANGQETFDNSTITGNYTTSDAGTGARPSGILTVPIGYMVIGVFTAILGLILLIGTTKRRLRMLNLWIVISVIELVLYAIGALLHAVIVMIYAYVVPGLFIFFTALFGIALSYYCIVVVSSFRIQIMSGSIPCRLS